jgi:hypothetical protein
MMTVPKLAHNANRTPHSVDPSSGSYRKQRLGRGCCACCSQNRARANSPAKFGAKASIPTGGIAAQPTRVASCRLTRFLTRRLFIDYQRRCSCACS